MVAVFATLPVVAGDIGANGDLVEGSRGDCRQGESALTGVATTVGALTHWPGVAEHVNCGLREACDAGQEQRAGAVAAEGPAFVTRIV